MFDFNEFLSAALQAILTVLLPLLIGYGVKYLKVVIEAKLAELQKQDPAAFWVLESVASYAVKAAEQMNLAGELENKKIYAMNLVQDDLERRGLDIDLGLIEAAIEAAVYENFNAEKAVRP